MRIAVNMEKHFRAGFTLIELVVVIAVIGIIAALITPALDNSKVSTKTVACLAHLKQIGVVSIAFAGDNSGQFPAATMPNTNRFLSPFQPILHEFGTAKLFVCPADSERDAAEGSGFLDRSNTSYFASYKATIDQPQSIVAGDRNFTVYTPAVPGAPGGIAMRETGAMVLFRTNSFGWWRDMHRGKGNLLLADGAVRTTKATGLNAQIAVQPDSSFVWNIPNGDSIFTPSP
jgi:prepilin-type N-terminal cleavage/methylation domain-containing protein/prepilin-type processing-associated H-X9-DG protein